MIVRKMTTEDIELLNLKYDWMKVNYERYLKNDVGPAWIVENEKNEPLCGFGGAFYWPGLIEVWFVLIKKEHTIGIIRLIKRYIEEQSKLLGIRRMQAMVKCDYEKGIRFVEKLGFRSDTPFGMRSYNADGSPAYLYAKVM